MKDAIKNNKKIIIIAVAIIVLLLLGIAFAYLVTTLNGEKEYLVRAGSLGLRLEEGNELTLEKQIPLTDEDGMSLDGFNFSLVNEGNIETDYTIYLDDIPLSEGETRMPDSSIRYSLTRNDVVGDADNLSNMGVNPDRVVDTGSIKVDETINYTLRIWIDYDATTEEASGKVFKGKLRVVATQHQAGAGETIIKNLTSGDTYDDGTDTFITGTNPNNYVWYSGKLWRAVSVNNEEKTTKLVTQWNISTTNYNPSNQTNFEGSYMEEWLNDTTVDGFLGNLREPEEFIVMDAKWNATETTTEDKPSETTIVEDAVGLLNYYEYLTSYHGTTYSNGYLNNGLYWWTLTPYSASNVRSVARTGDVDSDTPVYAAGVRPSISLKSNIRIAGGDGTQEDPYRLEGDNDTNLSGTYLKKRYSGEYVKFGNDENNLYRIVSHENGTGTKITSAVPLKSGGSFITSSFGSNTTFLSTNTIGTFLNGEYLNSYVNSNYSSMIEDSTTWYLGTVGSGTSYKLAKYIDTNMSSLISTTTDAKIGLLRFGELMSGQFDTYGNNNYYWTLTPYSTSYVRDVSYDGYASNDGPSGIYGIRPSLNLKSNAIITKGTGTKTDPFEIQLESTS